MLSYVKRSFVMAFSQSKYINQYNKENYKIYSFRVKKNDIDLIKFLDDERNRNQVIISLLKEESKKKILSIEEIKEKCAPLFRKYGIKEAYLFGSYARNEATRNSDVDIFTIGYDKSKPFGIGNLYLDLQDTLNKEIDLVENEAEHNQTFLNEIRKDFIKIY